MSKVKSCILFSLIILERFQSSCVNVYLW
jgi:hypothetical protein